MTVLVTGGAGYIGAHVVELLAQRGETVVVIDDLATGLSARLSGQHLLVLDLAREDSVQKIRQMISDHSVSDVIHFAARKMVAESVADPLRYYRDNVLGLVNLLSAVEGTSVRNFVFSSTAAVYGDVQSVSVDELAPLGTVNPYGESKRVGERILSDFAATTRGEFRYTSLRYFNVAGTMNTRLSERKPLNLIPMAIERLALGEAPLIFGDDYPTADGTCVRDFVHVEDLADAHIMSLDALRSKTRLPAAMNVGTGQGYSVRAVIEAIAEHSEIDVSPIVQERRQGDPPQVVADVSLIAASLGWSAGRTLSDMVGSAWDAYKELQAE